MTLDKIKTILKAAGVKHIGDCEEWSVTGPVAMLCVDFADLPKGANVVVANQLHDHMDVSDKGYIFFAK